MYAQLYYNMTQVKLTQYCEDIMQVIMNSKLTHSILKRKKIGFVISHQNMQKLSNG